MYISDKQFLDQTKKVQNSLIKWWKPSVGDIFIDLAPNSKKKPLVIEDEGDCIDIELVKYEIVPFFSEGQLRQYIEDKTNCYVEIIVGISGYVFVLRSKETLNEEKRISVLKHDLLQGYWELVIELTDI